MGNKHSVNKSKIQELVLNTDRWTELWICCRVYITLRSI